MAPRLQRARDFLVELRRRKVYRVAAIYLVAAAGALQLVDVVVPSTRLPEWSDELFLALAILGFPLAVVLAWAFEVTPQGVRRTPSSDDDPGREGEVDRVPDGIPPPGTDATLSGPTMGEDPAPTPLDPMVETSDLDVRRVAVLPFETLHGTEEGAPLAAGLHDDLLTELSKVPGLTVISRTSVKGYRDTDKPVGQIARELKVGTLVEAAVQSAGGRVRLNVQLIDARSDVHRWAERYDRELSAENIFEIQSELARKIADTLRVELAPEEEEERSAANPTDDLEAYGFHARGREQLDRRTEEGMRQAADHFRRAIERDPSYALAWVGLGDALGLLVSYGHEGADLLSEAERAVHRALELDPKSAEAHASHGLLHYLRREGPGAIRELERASELRPGYAEAHNWLSYVHLLLGHSEQALDRAKRAAELNPLSPEAISNLSLSWLAVGAPDRARREAGRSRDLEPSWTTSRFYDGLARYRLGRLDEAKALLRDLSAPWAGEGPRASLALAHAAAGEAAEARKLLAEIEGADDPFAAGLVHLALGEEDAAFEAFGRMDGWGDWPSLAVHGLYPDVFRPFEGDPQYAALLRAADDAWGVTPDERG